jgi:D-alanyl-D-alanine carboxypeptidase (penicillin-binding protein 5/6)
MRRLLCAVVVALAWSASASAAVPKPDARAFYVVNASNGEVLAARHARADVPIASITKLMTAIVSLEHLRPDDVVTVTRQAAIVGESRIPLQPGQRVTVRDLLKGSLIQSANNAAVALAAAAAGGDVPRFVAWMNEKARRLGLRDTHFTRPDGLDSPGHLSSARDVAVLAQVAMHSPVVRAIVQRRSDTIEGGRFTVRTWNDLLGRFPGLIGVKTGHTADAGWCQVAAARRSGFTIYAVILGSPTRTQRNDDLQALLAWGVSQYRTLALVQKTPYARAALGYGRNPVQLLATKPLVRVVRTGRPVVQRVVAPTVLSLPVRRGQRAGRIEVWAGGKLLGTRPLVVGRTVEEPGSGGKLRWYATRTMHHLTGLFS